MDHYLFAVRSATQAQRAARVLNSGGIHASVQRVPVEFCLLYTSDAADE